MGSKHSKGTTSTSHPVPFESYRVPFVDLQEATNNFDEKFFIGRGGFGKVYRGVLRDGTKVALKRYRPKSQQGLVEFQTEIEILSQFRHPHLISLIGYCDENSELTLIYEYMENGNLRRHLYGSDLPTLSWEQRLEICIGTARGLHYLHSSAIIHGDVKSTNILLDEHFVAKVTDFGVSQRRNELDQTHVTTVVKGTMGYLDPEYFRWAKLTEKSDVYSFGVVLLEVLCAKPAIDSSRSGEMISLAQWTMEWQKKGQLEQIIDPNLVGKIRPESFRKFGETALKCLALSGQRRPSMNEVLWNLEYALYLQEPLIQDDPEEKNNIPIGSQINDFSHAGEQSPQISEFSGVDASSSAAQIKTSNWDDLSSDEVISPR